jgi:hypothetical protein
LFHYAFDKFNFTFTDYKKLEFEYDALFDGLFAVHFKTFSAFTSNKELYHKMVIDIKYPVTFNVVLFKIILPVTVDNTALFIYQLKCLEFKELEQTNSMYRMESFNKEMQILKNELEAIKYSEQIESIVIASSIEEIWSIITDWMKFQSINSCTPIYLDGDKNFNEIGCTFKIKSVNDDVNKVEVVSVQIEKQKRKYCLNVHSKADENSVLFSMEFILIEIKDKLTYLEYKHKTNYFLDSKTANKISASKVKILKGLKRTLAPTSRSSI